MYGLMITLHLTSAAFIFRVRYKCVLKPAIPDQTFRIFQAIDLVNRRIISIDWLILRLYKIRVCLFNFFIQDVLSIFHALNKLFPSVLCVSPGGVRTAMYGTLPKQILSTFGYQGCLASIDLNGEAADPIANALVPSTLIAEGCDGEWNVDSRQH